MCSGEFKVPRLVIAATQSGAGKTTIVTGLLAALRARGLKVQPFKVGPDYIDPGYHTLASGQKGHNLDTWLVPPDKIADIFAAEAKSADIAIIEGVMGLYDGGRSGVSSTAEIAKLLVSPVLLVIDCKSVGASAAATALGFREYDDGVNFAGVILNRLGSDTHEAMIRETMAAQGITVFGALRRDDKLVMSERHLGLTPVEENEAAATVAAMGSRIETSLDVDEILALAQQTAPMALSVEYKSDTVGSKKCRIGVARDEAFSFYYPASLAVLKSLGAEIVTFSPLNDEAIPNVDALIIGGGFPEMFAEKLAANFSMRQSIREASVRDMPIYAECGGYMYLMQTLVDFEGTEHDMVGVFPLQAIMTNKLQMVGYVSAEIRAESFIGDKGSVINGHEFHFSTEVTTDNESIDDKRPFEFTKMRDGRRYLAGYQVGQTIGSYLHLHFAGCPDMAKNLVEAAKNWDA